jgi:hypothetical protein
MTAAFQIYAAFAPSGPFSYHLKQFVYSLQSNEYKRRFLEMTRKVVTITVFPDRMEIQVN